MGLREFFGLKPNVDMSALPSNVSKLTGNKEHGPNCWNATMLYFHTDEIVRYVPPNEMNEWLSKNTTDDYFKTCAPGTILALYCQDYICEDEDRPINSNDEGLVHTAVWVAPGLLWHKYGCGGPWEFITEKQLRKAYPEADRWEYRIIKDKI